MPEDRAITVETAGGETLTFTHLVGHRRDQPLLRVHRRAWPAPSSTSRPDALVNQPLAIEAEAGDPKRWFHGLVSEFRLVKLEERVANYEVVLRPWLWLLGLTYDCRIFQNLSVIEIVEEIFGKYPEAAFEKRLQKSYPPREYCVQYDESDLDFVQRLLEHEGIFYFFEYAEGGHTLVLADAIAKLKPAQGYDDGAVPPRGQPGAPRPRLPVALAGRELAAPGRLRPYRLQLREAEPVAADAVRGRAGGEALQGRELPPAGRAPGPRARGRGGGDPARGAAGAARAGAGRRARRGGLPRAASSSWRAIRARARTPSTWCCAPTTAWSIPSTAPAIDGAGRELPRRARRGADRPALPAAAHARRGR